MKSTNHRFATEVQQDTEGAQRVFSEHGSELIILCDNWETGYPIGKIFISPAGILIELHEGKEGFPVTVNRSTSETT